MESLRYMLEGFKEMRHTGDGTLNSAAGAVPFVVAVVFALSLVKKPHKEALG